MNDNEFLAWEQASRDTIDVKRAYIRLAGDIVAGVVLSQIVFWHLPARDGRSRMSIERDGFRWVAHSQADWERECCIRRSQLDRALRDLQDAGLIEVRLYQFAGAPTRHIRIVWERFLPALEQVINTPLGEPIADNQQNDLDTARFVENLRNDLHETSETICTNHANPIHRSLHRSLQRSGASRGDAPASAGDTRDGNDIAPSMIESDQTGDVGAGDDASPLPVEAMAVFDAPPVAIPPRRTRSDRSEPREAVGPSMSEPPPASSSRASKRTRDARLDHPAIRAWREVMRAYPPRTQPPSEIAETGDWWDVIITAVGDDADGLRDALRAWQGVSNNRYNVLGVLDMYRERKTGRRRPRGGVPASPAKPNPDWGSPLDMRTNRVINWNDPRQRRPYTRQCLIAQCIALTLMGIEESLDPSTYEQVKMRYGHEQGLLPYTVLKAELDEAERQRGERIEVRPFKLGGEVYQSAVEALREWEAAGRQVEPIPTRKRDGIAGYVTVYDETVFD